MSSPIGSEPRECRLLVLAGPSGVGKGTVVDELRRRHPNVWVSVSVTTRPPRPGERHGEHYLFVTDADFDAMIAAGELLEWARLHGRHRSGTPRRPVQEAVAAGLPALLEIDLQGARQVRAALPDACFVFLAPPSWAELVSRLQGRGTEPAAERERRLATARQEMAAEPEFDVTVVNADVRRAADEVAALWGSLGGRPAGERPAGPVRPATDTSEA